MDRIASWQVEDGDIVHFRYQRDGVPFAFYVTQANKPDVLRDIGRMAANDACPLTWHDAQYLTQLIREVMNMQLDKSKPCDCKQCVAIDRGAFWWSLMMFVCSFAAMFTLAVFVLWGAR